MDYDVVIVGAGPAGLTAAIYASRARLKTLVIESFSVPGQAIMTDCIENYPGFPDSINGFELIDRFRKQAIKFGAEFSAGNVMAISEYAGEKSNGWQLTVEDKTYTSLSVIIASGARPKHLGVPGEDRLRGGGVSYCATCDGALYKDRDVIVVGGGDTSVEEALFLTRFAKKVTMVHRRERLRASKILQERAVANNKIEFIWNSVVVEILGDEKVEKIKVKDIKTDKECIVLCEGVFVFIGYLPNTKFVNGFLELDANNYLMTNDYMETSKKGIFACGDCRKKSLRQVVTACGDAATAAFSAQQYIEEIKGTSYK